MTGTIQIAQAPEGETFPLWVAMEDDCELFIETKMPGDKEETQSGAQWSIEVPQGLKVTCPHGYKRELAPDGEYR